MDFKSSRSLELGYETSSAMKAPRCKIVVSEASELVLSLTMSELELK